MFLLIKTLEGNNNARRFKEQVLRPPIRTSSIRIYPKMPYGVEQNETLERVSCLRLELYGCSAPGK